MRKKLTRGQKAWQTRKANQKKGRTLIVSNGFKVGDKLHIKMPKDYVVSDGPAFTKSGPLVSDLGSTMVLLERAIDDLIIRINLQTQRIKDMM